MSGRPRLSLAVSLLGVALALVGLLDSRPEAARWLWLGPLLALGGAAAGRGRLRVGLGLLATAFSLAGFARPEFRADAGSYFVYLRSLSFDRDVDFANDWALLGRPRVAEQRTATGHVPNTQTLGPALAWAPFYAAAHLYVTATRAVGGSSWPADGASEPYRRALAAGTVAAVLLGAWLLLDVATALWGGGPARLAVVVAVLASPVVYYTFIVPGMAHGLAFALAAALLAALQRAKDVGSLRAWLVVGAVLGGLVLVRTQAAVLGLVVLPCALAAWRRGQVGLRTLAGAAALAAFVFLPQALAWKAIFGAYLTVPQGGRYLDWSSPHLQEVLFSANHGLVATTPALALGLVGLLIVARRDPPLGVGSLLAVAALAWTNGAVADWDWEGGDAFGARRFDVAVPLLALGLAAGASALRDLAARRPLLLPAVVALPFVFWNLGLLAVFRSGRYPDATPLDRVARDQALLARRIAEGAMGAAFGDPGRAAAYDFFAGEYLFGALGRHGVLRLASADERTLAHGFSPPAWREDGPAFRWAHFPEACLNLPLTGDRKVGALGLLARAPRRTLPQTVTLVARGKAFETLELGAEWSMLRFTLPESALRAGPNEVCLRFARGLPGDDASPAAALAEVRLSATADRLGGPERSREAAETP